MNMNFHAHFEFRIHTTYALEIATEGGAKDSTAGVLGMKPAAATAAGPIVQRRAHFLSLALKITASSRLSR